jgi:APA family basic amino acid/polyamine antiporter
MRYPNLAYGFNALVASILCLSGTYGNLLDMISFVVVIFYVLNHYRHIHFTKKTPGCRAPVQSFWLPGITAQFIL